MGAARGRQPQSDRHLSPRPKAAVQCKTHGPKKLLFFRLTQPQRKDRARVDRYNPPPNRPGSLDLTVISNPFRFVAAIFAKCDVIRPVNLPIRRELLKAIATVDCRGAPR